MCKGCWEEAGSPQIVSESVLNAVGLIDAVYQYNAAGGSLHCTLDDINLSTEFMKSDPEYIEMWAEKGGQYEAETACHLALMELTLPERYSAVAIYNKWFTVEKENNA